MANPTTNFGWVMPTSTSLVTNLPADFNTFGQAVDTSMSELLGGTTGQVLSKTSNTNMDFTWVTPQVGDITGVTAGTGISGGGTSGTVTVTNDMATTITASGDIVVGTGSGTYDNLPIGTTGQVLTADTTVSPYKVKWASAGGSSGLTLISRTSFTNVASQAFDSVFTSTYFSYLVVIDELLSTTTANDDVYLRYRYSGSTQSSGYYGTCINAAYNSGTVTNTGSNGATQATIAVSVGSGVDKGSGYMFVSRVGVSDKPISNGAYFDSNGAVGNNFTSNASTQRVYDGFILSLASSNMSGIVSIYGLAM